MNVWEPGALEQRAFIAQRDEVVVLLHGDSTPTRTNHEVVTDDRIACFVSYDDTTAIADAYRGQ
jgi:hypothetical protein